MTNEYEGPVVFVDGVHYPATEQDEEGAVHADLSRPLRHVSDTTYRDAGDGEPLHNDANHQNDAELPVGGENE